MEEYLNNSHFLNLNNFYFFNDKCCLILHFNILINTLFKLINLYSCNET